MRAWPLAALVLLGCTGQNVDENFVSTHGALLARVTCDSGINSPQIGGGWRLHYEALMFLDGSVLASGVGDALGTHFIERSDASRVHARIETGSYAVGCSGTNQYEEINSGSLQFIDCVGSPQHYAVMGSMTLSTDCSGFNMSLFN